MFRFDDNIVKKMHATLIKQKGLEFRNLRERRFTAFVDRTTRQVDSKQFS